MADKLGIYNEALQTHLDTKPLLTLSDARSERRALDAVWASALAFMTEQGMWNHATRTAQLFPSETMVPQFGYQNAYEKPDDYVRLTAIADNEWLRPTLSDYKEEGDFFFADIDDLHVSYVSNDATLGSDPGKWGASFATAFAAELAFRGAGGIKPLSSTDKDLLFKIKRRLLINALAKDCVNQAVAELPVGRLVRSRGGLSGNNRMRRTPYA